MNVRTGELRELPDELTPAEAVCAAHAQDLGADYGTMPEPLQEYLMGMVRFGALFVALRDWQALRS